MQWLRKLRDSDSALPIGMLILLGAVLIGGFAFAAIYKIRPVNNASRSNDDIDMTAPVAGAVNIIMAP